MGQYDITLRDLTRTGGHAFLRTVGGEGLLTLLQTDFPSTRDRRVDFLAVHDSPDGLQQLLHIEFQSTPDSTMAARMLGYGTSSDVIRDILNKIAGTPGSDGADALAQLIILSELRGIRPLIEQEYSTMPITVSVENSTILRPPIDRAYDLGLAKGKAEGEAKGKAEGHAHGIAEAIATILDQRFPGQVPAGLSDRLSAVSAEALYEILHKCLAATSVKDALGNSVPLNGSQSKA